MANWTATSISCTLGAAAAGSQVVLVTVAGQGLAASPTAVPVRFTALVEVRCCCCQGVSVLLLLLGLLFVVVDRV